jgi:putative transcriptional regulator
VSRTKPPGRKTSARTSGGQTRRVISDELFAELRESVRQGGAVLRGVREPSRVYEVTARGHGQTSARKGGERTGTAANGMPDVGALRIRFKLSQAKFAALLGISAATVRNWEQGRRMPEGPARVLLQVAERYPEAVLDVVAAAVTPPAGTGRRPA